MWAAAQPFVDINKNIIDKRESLSLLRIEYKYTQYQQTGVNNSIFFQRNSQKI